MKIEAFGDRRLRRVGGVHLGFDPSPHPFHLAHEDAARENWRREIERLPRLFDGKVLLASDAEIENDVFRARCHIVPFSTFLYWRAMRPVAGACHIFAMPLIVAAGGAVLLGRMGEHTANAGLWYAPSGSFDPDDLAGDRFSVMANVGREIGEETGLSLCDAAPEDGYAVYSDGAIVTIVRRLRFPFSRDALLERVKAHIAADPDPEIVDAATIGADETRPSPLAGHMGPILDWHFSRD